MTNAIEISGLTKRYGPVVAVHGLSLTVSCGETFGLLGPNGAGKTTTVECIEGVRRPDGGSIRVLGIDAVRYPQQVKARIGVQLQATSLPPLITPREALELFASFYPNHRPAASLLGWAGLAEQADRPYERLSGGQKQRLALALALVNDPELVILDEPTAGLDAHARNELHELIKQFRDEGRTVLLTTHYIEEAEKLCDRVAILHRGRLIACGHPAELIREVGAQHSVELTVRGPTVERLAIPEGCRLVVRSQPRADRLRLKLLTESLSRAITELVQQLPPGSEIESLHVRSATLEEAFLKLTDDINADRTAAETSSNAPVGQNRIPADTGTP